MSKKHERQQQKRRQQAELKQKMKRFDRGLTVGLAIAAGLALAFLIFLMLTTIFSIPPYLTHTESACRGT